MSRPIVTDARRMPACLVQLLEQRDARFNTGVKVSDHLRTWRCRGADVKASGPSVGSDPLVNAKGVPFLPSGQRTVFDRTHWLWQSGHRARVSVGWKLGGRVLRPRSGEIHRSPCWRAPATSAASSCGKTRRFRREETVTDAVLRCKKRQAPAARAKSRSMGSGEWGPNVGTVRPVSAER
jgi:hypothetical protein